MNYCTEELLRILREEYEPEEVLAWVVTVLALKDLQSSIPCHRISAIEFFLDGGYGLPLDPPSDFLGEWEEYFSRLSPLEKIFFEDVPGKIQWWQSLSQEMAFKGRFGAVLTPSLSC